MLSSKIKWFPLSLPMLLNRPMPPSFNVRGIQEQFTGAPNKAVPKHFTNFTGACGYRRPFLSGCCNTACNFSKNDHPIKVFCCEFY